jgi:hypothetical protein
MDFRPSWRLVVQEVAVTSGCKVASRSEELRTPIKFIFPMKIAVHFCMAAHHLRRGGKRGSESQDEVEREAGSETTA